MSEKQAKRKRVEQQAAAPKVVGQIVFNLLDNNQVQVAGMINDPIAVVEIMSVGMKNLVAFWAREKANAGGKILTPAPGMLPPNFGILGKG
jgi:hypothetical protein